MPAPDASAQLQRLARHVPGLLFQYELAPDGSGRFLYVSERGGEIFGLEVAEVMQDSLLLFNTIGLQDRRVMAQMLRASAVRMDEWRCEFQALRTDGVLRRMSATATPVRGDKGWLVWHGYVEDITEHHQLEQARRDAAVAAEANRAKTEFLSRMSHELRTPLNAVLGFTQLMEMDTVEPPAEGQQRRLKLIREAGEHLLQMISDMLHLTRIEAGGMTLHPETVALPALGAQALEMVRDLADKAQVRLSLQAPSRPAAKTPTESALTTGGVEPASAVDLTVYADRTRLRQVLINLLVNAIKYNRPGGRVELWLRSVENGRVELSVADTGLGIAEEDLPRIFEPFQRGRHAGGDVDGAGIGLAVTRSLVLLMGGDIHARSTLDAGSVFTVRLAALPAPAVP